MKTKKKSSKKPAPIVIDALPVDHDAFRREVERTAIRVMTDLFPDFVVPDGVLLDDKES